MLNRLTLLFFLFFSTFCFAQTISLKGKVTDDQDFPLEAATVYFTSVKDSAVVDYTITDKNGNWELKTRKIEQPVYFKISFIGLSNHNIQLESVLEDRDFGHIKLADKSTELSEVVIEGEIPPIRIKSDTLEFNASSFKVRPDANVQTLLKQLPGVEIDSDGKITVNGKEVNQILVNGKPFFDKDGKVALQNLPAEMINKVQVTDTKTKMEELSGKKASGDNASINLTIDEDKNKGLFGKFTGGYGSSERYESSGIFNYFKGDRRVSALASFNNINTNGFSMDEVFDNMGGGRNNNLWLRDGGGFWIGDQMFGGEYGITESGLAGINYSDEFIKDFDTDGSYFYSMANTKNDNRTHREILLPSDGTVDRRNITDSYRSSKNDVYAHNFNAEFELKIDSTSTVNYKPKFTQGSSKASALSGQVTTDQGGNILNEASGETYSENDNKSFGSELTYHKSLNKRGRGLIVNMSNENNLDNGANYQQSETYFFADSDGDGLPDTPADIRNQVRYDRRTSDSYNFEVEFSEPITDTLKLNLNLKYNYQQSVENRKGFDYSDITDDYTIANNELTNYLSSSTNEVTPGVGIDFYKKKYSISAYAGTAITKFDNFSSYMGTNYNVNKNYMLPDANARFSYRFDKGKSASINYHFYTMFPRASQILPVEDLSNPLYTEIGNPNLNPTKSQSISLSYWNYDWATRSGINSYFSFNFSEDDIINYTEIDENGKSTSTYANINGTYNIWFSLNYSKQFKKDSHTFKPRIGVSSSYDYSKGLTNSLLYDARSLTTGATASLSYEYGELLTITPAYRFNYNQINYSNYSVDQTSYFSHNFRLETTSYWPKHVVFGNDFVYNYNSQLGEGFKKDYFLWNASIGYNFLQEKFLFKVKVYDILNQNLGTSRSITPTSIYDQQNTVLKRYVMFSLTYKLEMFGFKEKKRKESRFFSW